MIQRVLLDTSGLFALVTSKDAHHRDARLFVQQLARQNGRLVVLDWVFVEAMTLMKARLKIQVAVTIGNRIRSHPFYEWLMVKSEAEKATWEIFTKYKDKEWSYQDCALLAVSRQLHVNQVFSFDHHFDQMPGIRRVPKYSLP